MMYEYLHPFVVDLAPSNKGTWFRKLEHSRILEAEARLGYTFPRQIRTFYEEIGFGCLRTGLKEPLDERWRALANRILHPMTVAALNLGEAEINPDPPLRKNEWPVFEGLDGEYLIVDPFAGEPNAIYTRYKIKKVEADFAAFMRRLFHEDVAFYVR
jgi:hypothetical protein